MEQKANSHNSGKNSLKTIVVAVVVVLTLTPSIKTLF